MLLADEVRGNYPALPVILTSSGEKPARLRDAEIFIRKPYRLEDIVAMVRENLGVADLA